MNIYDKLYLDFEKKGERIKIEKLMIGISYTAVKLSNGKSGLSFTWADKNIKTISHNKNFTPEGSFASEYLDFIKSENSLKKSIGMALINALNHEFASTLPGDDNNNGLFSHLKIDENSKISMVGDILPLVKKIKSKKIIPEILDSEKKTGNENQFLANLESSDILIISSSAILGSGFEKILEARGKNTETVLIGPTTPMTPDVFKNKRISILAGSHTITEFNQDILRETAHGKGTPVLKKFSRKIILKL